MNSRIRVSVRSVSRRSIGIALAALLACVGACHTAHTPPTGHASPPRTPTPAAIAPPALDATQPLDLAGVHQIVTYAPGVYSGSMPEGDAGLASLASMGIKTIISVDGAEPDVAGASKYGMRYVHLPIGYNGVSHERTLEIARAVQDLPGPTFIHCHHGKHRSAAAAGAALVALGRSTPETMVSRMKVSKTAESYKGLWKSVQDATLASPAELASASDEFPSISKPTGLVRSMVDIDHIFEHIRDIEKAGWTTPADHPDLVPAAEAGRLANLFRNLDADPKSIAHGDEFRAWMRESATLAARVEEALVAVPKGSAPSPAAREALSTDWTKIANACKQCHVQYRDF